MKFFNYKDLLSRAKAFNYKDTSAYIRLLKDPKFLKALIAVAIFFIALVFLKSCIFKPKQVPIPLRPVQTASVIKKDVPIYIESFGTISALENVDIQSQVTGKIKSVNFTEGDEVSKGDLLFVIDTSEYAAKLQKAEASLAQDIAELKLNTDNLKRNKTLVERDLISKQDFESFQTEVEAGKAAVELNKANVDLAKIDLGYCYVQSPIDGLTGKRQVDPGNIVTANSGRVLVNIKSVDPYYLDFTISERSLADLLDAKSKGALKVVVRPEGDKDNEVEGELVFLDNTVDDTTGTIFLRAIISNKNRKLWAGQFVTVYLILKIDKDAILAPYAAVRIGQKGHYLFAITDENKADLRLLTVGMRDDDYIIVEKGVKEGEKVVVVGELGLSPGAEVVDVTKNNTDNKEDK